MKKLKNYFLVTVAALAVGIFIPSSVVIGNTGCPQNSCDISTGKCTASGVPSGLQQKCMDGNLPVSGSEASCTGTSDCIPGGNT
jgi:hypothetical protein